jgi:hypothetical protein
MSPMGKGLDDAAGSSSFTLAAAPATNRRLPRLRTSDAYARASEGEGEKGRPTTSRDRGRQRCSLMNTSHCLRIPPRAQPPPGTDASAIAAGNWSNSSGSHRRHRPHTASVQSLFACCSSTLGSQPRGFART